MKNFVVKIFIIAASVKFYAFSRRNEKIIPLKTGAQKQKCYYEMSYKYIEKQQRRKKRVNYKSQCDYQLITLTEHRKYLQIKDIFILKLIK